MKGPYKIGTLSRLTGFSPAVIRAWERRFRLLAPARGEGGQRLYGEPDLEALRRIRANLDAGRTIGEIVRADRAENRAAGLAAEPGVETAVGVQAWRQRIIAAGLALDSQTLSAALDDAFAALRADAAVAEVVAPVAIEVGRLWQTGACSVASEHLVSDQCLHRIRGLLDAAQPPDPDAPCVVSACFPDEQHQLGLAILSWHLARRGLRVAYLGSALPLDDLFGASAAARARVAVLSVTRAPVFAAHYPSIRRWGSTSSRGLRVVIGGQGVPPSVRGTVPPRVVLAGHLPLDTALSNIVALARGAGARPGQAGRS